MKTLRRYDIRPATYFITAVTFERKPILLRAPEIFLYSWQLAVPIAWVLMPEHFHVLVSAEHHSVSRIMYRFKLAYRYEYEAKFGKGRIWQCRFWDHIIRDEMDFRRHLDYIHYNPVRHGMVSESGMWTTSSYLRWLEEGYYDEGWGVGRRMQFDGGYGE